MKAVVKNLDNKEVGSIELLDSVYAVEPRRDILTRMVNYQLAKRRSGNHATKCIGQIPARPRSHGRKRAQAVRVKVRFVRRNSARVL